MAKLQNFPWPGNVRQLRAVLESAAVMADGESIDDAALPPSLDVDDLKTQAMV